ncbi:MAG: UvrD-helicase domain-containing protein [Lentisphaeria bacterium]|nr:UvrD-helicase domain-containing protein [Lentisphaeria bacterium]
MNKSKNFDSFSISASAGCGKTYKMAIRMLGMFLSDVENPEKIFNSSIAMTFSRSGAKEIYNRILELIFDALFKNEIESLNNDLKQLEFIVPDADREMLLKLLRKLIYGSNAGIDCTRKAIALIYKFFAIGFAYKHNGRIFIAY